MKFIKSKFNGLCKQTGKKIKVGDDVFYIPGRGTYHPSSEVYKERKKSLSDPSARMISPNKSLFSDQFPEPIDTIK